MISTIIGWFGPLYSSPIAYVVTATIIFLDRAAFTGLVVPGELFVALGGVYAGRGELSLPAVIAVAAAGGIVGESVSFWLGRRYGERVIKHLPFSKHIERNLDTTRKFLERHGGKTVLIARYVSVVGTFTPFILGTSDMPYGRFLAFDVVAIVAWATGVTMLGYVLNSQIQLVDQILSQVGWGLLALLVVVFLVRLVVTRRDRIQKWVSEKNPFG